MFTFFLQSYRKGILTFCGSHINQIEFNVNEIEGKNVFRKYDNGEYKNISIKTRHPNIVKGVIIGKKSWGLHVKMWSEGVREGTFTKNEILGQFTDKDIKIPEPFLKEFYNKIY